MKRRNLAAATGLSLSLLATSCFEEPEPNSRVEDAICVEAEGLSAEELSLLSGAEMRQDFNNNPLFRAATINIASSDGYGSGALHRHPDGQLVVRTIRHVLESTVAAQRGGIFFPGIGWWNISGCNLEAVSLERVGGSATEFGDAISEIRLPQGISDELETRIQLGEIQPLTGVQSDNSEFNPDVFAARGDFALIPRADTGLWTELSLDIESYEPGDNIVRLLPITNEDGEPIYTGNVCAGRSGQPILIGNLASGSIYDVSIGAVSLITDAGRDYIGLNPSFCSPNVTAVTYTE